MLLFMAMSLAFSSIIGSVAVNVSVMPQGGAMLGNTVGRSLLIHMKEGNSYISGDELLGMADNSPTPCAYSTLHSDFQFATDVNFHIDMYSPLAINVTATSPPGLPGEVAATVTKTLRREPAQTFVHLYIFNGTDVTDSLIGETSLDGKVFFRLASFTTTEVGVLFAHAGASTSYSVFDNKGIGLQTGQLYIKNGSFNNIGGVSANVTLFAFEDWRGSVSLINSVNVDGYSLPVLLLYKDNVSGAYMYSPHPWVPGSCGPEPSTIKGTFVSDQAFSFRVEAGTILVMRLRTWGTGGE